MIGVKLVHLCTYHQDQTSKFSERALPESASMQKGSRGISIVTQGKQAAIADYKGSRNLVYRCAKVPDLAIGRSSRFLEEILLRLGPRHCPVSCDESTR